MPGVIAVCPVHGPFQSRAFTIGAEATIINCSVSCPTCGRQSPIPSGVYDVVGDVVRVLLAPSTNWQNAVAIKKILHALKSGTITTEAAESQVSDINPAFRQILHWAGGDTAKIALLISILALFVAIYQAYSGDHAASQAHRDAQGLHQDMLLNDADAHQQTEFQQKIYAELEKQSANVGTPAPSSLQSAPQEPNLGDHRPNRHERRKSTALKRGRRLNEN